MKRELFNFDWIRTLGKLLPREESRNAKKVDLPDDFILELPRSPEAMGGARVGFAGDGFATYTKIFDMPEAWKGKRILLNLDGAYMCAEITLNEDLIGMHPYGYSPYTLDITDKLRSDMENKLVITTQGIQPSSRWYSGAGLYRNVDIWIGEPCYLDPRDLFITTPVVEKERGVVRVETAITNTLNQDKPAKLIVALSREGAVQVQKEATIDLVASGKTTAVMELEIANPDLWDDITPNLYDAVITVEAEGLLPDITEKKVGLRKIEICAEDGLRINGRKCKLYGGCIHHDHGLLGAKAFSDAEERKMRNLKAAGFNAIRTAHNPPSEALLDACDRIGILVLDEFFDCWRTGKNQNDYHLWFETWWQRDIEYTVLRDRNHPSVYCWSFGNEIPEANGYSDCEYWMKAQADFIRSLDNTRLVTCGGMFLPKHMTCDGQPGGPGAPPARINPYSTQEETERRWTNMIDNLDIVSLNYSFRNYEQFHKLFPDKVLQGTETRGIDAWGNREAVLANDHVIGDFMWTAHDNLGEAGAGRSYWEEPKKHTGLMAEWPWLSCYQGDLALDGERLPRSYYRKVIWGKDQGVYVFVKHPEHAGQPGDGTGFHWHDVRRCWTYAETYIGKPVDVEAYADCEEVWFYVNGELAAKSRPDAMIASAAIAYEPGELRAVSYKNGEVVAEDRIRTTGSVQGIRLEAERMELQSDGMALSYVTMELVDEYGQRVMDDDRELTVSVFGAASLAGLGSNNPCTPEDFGTGRRLTWNGKAMAVLRAGRTKGEAQLNVTTPGLPAASITITIQ